MRYLKAVLVGLLGSVLLTAAVLAVELVYAERVTAKQMAQCEAASITAGGGKCFAAVQFAHVRYLGLTSAVGFAAGSAWFLRRHRRVVA